MQPTTTVLAAVLPMFIIHWIWRVGTIVYASLDWYGRISPSDDTEDIFVLAVVIESGLLMGGIMVYVPAFAPVNFAYILILRFRALLVVGFKSDAWSLVARHPVYTGLAVVPDTYAHQEWTPQPPVYQTQQVVQYPQQQQWHATSGGAYAQAPVYPHQPVAPNLPQV